MTHKIDNEVLTLYNELKKENPNLDNDMVMMFLEKMPKEAKESLEIMQYGKHIISKSLYEDALRHIKDKSGSGIVPWSIQDVMKIASNYINIDDEKFFDYDLALWSNVKRGDYGHIEKEPSKIIEIAIADLKDRDYPFGDPSERAYCWAKEILDKEEKY